MALATGQITIVDLSDGISLQGYLTSSAAKMQYLDAKGVYSPNWATTPMVITAELYQMSDALNLMTAANIGAGKTIRAVRWYETNNGGLRTLITSGAGGYVIGNGGATLTVNQNQMSRTITAVDIECEMDYAPPSPALPVMTYKTSISYGLTIQGDAGIDAYTVVMDNDNFSIPSDSTGLVAGGLNAADVNVQVYKGVTQISGVNVTTVMSSGFINTGHITGNGTNNVKVNFTTVDKTAITSTELDTTKGGGVDKGSCMLTITADGQTFTKQVTWVKAKDGGSYKLTSSNGTIKRNKANSDVFDISQLSFTLTNKGVNVLDAYWKFYTTMDGVNWVEDTSKAGKKTAMPVVYPLPTSGDALMTLEGVKAVAYDDAGYTILLDTESIPVLEQGSDAWRAFVNALDGNVFKNYLGANPTLRLSMEFYSGATAEKAQSYRWYKQDPTVKRLTAKLTAAASAGATSFAVDNIVNLMIGQEIKLGATVVTNITNIIGNTVYCSPALSAAVAINTYLACRGYDPTIFTNGNTIISGTDSTKNMIKVANATGFNVGQDIVINDNDTQVATITAITGTTIYLDNGIDSDPTNGQPVRIKGWFDPQGWYYLPNTGSTLADNYEIYDGANSTTLKADGSLLKIYAKYVNSMEVFKCVAITNVNGYFPDTVVVTDQTDPYQTSITSTGGTTFKNSTGSTELSCKVFQQGNEIDLDGSQINYTWSKYNALGNREDETTNPQFIANPKTAASAAVEGITFSCADASAIATVSATAIGRISTNAYYWFGTEKKKVTAVSGTTITVSTPFTAAQAAGANIYPGNYKTILITAADITDKATFFCDISKK